MAKVRPDIPVHVNNIMEVINNLLKTDDVDVDVAGELLFDALEADDTPGLREAALELKDILDNALER